jgi:hypothetical protein
VLYVTIRATYNMNDFVIIINNERIWRFFKERNPGLHVEECVTMFIDVIEKLTENMNASLNTSMFTNLFENVKQLQTQIDGMSRIQVEQNIGLSAKLAEFKREYIEDVKMILSTNVSDKIAPLIREQNSILMDKTNILLNDVLPKSNDQLSKHLSGTIREIQKTIMDDTHKYFSGSTISPQSLQEFISTLDTKLSSSLQLSQAQTEKRIDASIREIKASSDANLGIIKELSCSSQQAACTLTQSVSEVLKKMENSSIKGKISENILFNTLVSLYPCAQIDSVGTTKETGDIIITRKDRPRILVENKNWDKNVVQEEVKKFLHDVEQQNCCGLFLSQNCGIANKEDFEINVHNGNVLVYVHQAKNDPDKIKIAISIIDHFKMRLDQMNDKSTMNVDTICKERLDNINQEYQAFVTQKLAMIRHVRDFQSKLCKMIDDVRLPSLEEHLSTRYATSASKYTCQFCEVFHAKNQQSLSAHHRGCSKKKLIDQVEQDNE